MLEANEFFSYIKNHYQIKGQEEIIQNIINFVYSRSNWGISYKSYALMQMLGSLHMKESEILEFLTKAAENTDR